MMRPALKFEYEANKLASYRAKRAVARLNNEANRISLSDIAALVGALMLLFL